ncbi:MAG: amino acid adenylation domain-containing protein [Candidatus Eremiobacterota bacterium]
MMNNYLSLTYPQKGIWYMEKLHTGTTMWNLPYSVKFREELDYILLERAINITIEKNDALRLRFKEIEGEPEQYVTPYKEEKIDFFDFTGKTYEEKEWITKKSQIHFNLIKDNLFYFALMNFSEGERGFFINVHHIVADGGSVAIIIQQIMDSYYSLKEGKSISHEKKPSYIDFIDIEYDYLKSESAEKDREFWAGEFQEAPEPADIKSFKLSKTIKTERKFFYFPPELSGELYRFCKENKTSIFRIFIAAFYTYAFRVTGKTEVVFGTAYHNRIDEISKNTVGMYASVLPFKLEGGNTEFKTLLSDVRTKLKFIDEHQRYPYDLILRDVKSHDPECKGLYDIVISQHLKNLFPEGSDVEFHCNGNFPYPLTMYIRYHNRDEHIPVDLIIDFQTDKFTGKEIEEIYEHMLNIIRDGLANPDKIISDIEILSDREKKKLIYFFNDYHGDYPLDKIFIHFFEEQVLKTPRNTAVVYKDKQLTYEELNKKANQLAAHLRRKGIKPDSPVCILVERSIEMILGVVAILKSGAGYVPIEADYPRERISYILEDTGSPVLLSQRHLSDKIAFAGTVLDLEDEHLYTGDTSNLPPVNKPSDLAYVIYTSGSTGKPKGVMIEQHSLTNFCFWAIETHEYNSEDRIAKLVSFNFDVSIPEIFPTLCTGGAIHVIPEELKYSIYELNNYFEENKITGVCLPTAFGEQFMELVDNKSLRWADIAGEKLKSFRKRNYTLINGYGPTENTVYTTGFVVDKSYPVIPIGKPLTNTRVYILDKFNNLLPSGYPGELCCAGENVARGYFNKPELTAEKFVPDPFLPGERMYHTGDLARWLPDGNIEFFGRMDHQVKIRGFRVETGEIEQILLSQDGIKEAVVLAKLDKNSNKYLCAYIVASKEISTGELKKTLSKDLPDYMVPTYIIQLEAMPLTPNGKIDRKALPEPETEASKDYVPPENDTEKKLVEIWEEILAINHISIEDNFFSIGGHSLKAAILQAKILKTFNVTVSFNEIFKSPTVKLLAEKIGKLAREEFLSVIFAEEKDFYPLSSAQKRLFIINQMEPDSITYNVPITVTIEGNLDIERLGKAIDGIVERHESFRTYFEIINGEPVQKIKKYVRFKRSYLEDREENIISLMENFIEPFDLSKAPLMRSLLVKVGPQKYILLLDFHHIIFDGMSTPVFFRDLWNLYEGKDVSPLKNHYKDYAVWQNKLMESPLMEKEEEFWLNMFSGEVPVLDLPSDNPRMTGQDNRGETFDFSIDGDLTGTLRRLASETGTTLYMVLMCAFNVLLSKYTSQEDIVVGTLVGGREREEFHNLIGMFVNTLAIRNYPQRDKSFKDFLYEVKDTLLKTYSNQDYQLETLIDKLNIKRETGRNPLFEVFFILQNMDKPVSSVEDLTISFKHYENKIAKFDLSLDAWEGDFIKFSMEYRTSLFEPSTIKRMAEHFTALLREAVRNPDEKIKNIHILSRQEEKQILYEFNRTEMPCRSDKVIHYFFEEEVEKYPDKPAVVCKDKKITYRELNEKANQLAKLLMSFGVKNDERVGLMISRSVDMIVGIMAVLKAGGAYVPIDPVYPKERIEYMLSDSTPLVLLSEKELYEKINFSGRFLDIRDEELYRGDVSNLPIRNKSSDLAYMIYTSGSTGKPKGVMIEHRALVNLITWHRQNYGISEEDNCAEYASFSFDASISQIFSPLTSGATLHIISEDIRLSPQEISKYIDDNHITYIDLPTQFCEYFMEAGDSKYLRRMTTGGDKLKKFIPRNYKLIDEYGPTEYTVITTCFTVDRIYHRSPIGKPVGNTRIYIVDRNFNLQPVGVPGELCIAGKGLARGYLNRPDLTQEKFVNNPFSPGERMYRTGDLARWLPDGNIDFIGRIDYQVKIRGFRIELGEIEQVIRQEEGIKDAVVIDRTDQGGNKYLCAYIITDREIDTEELKHTMSRELPDYMIPPYIIKLEKIPVTPNGKVDRRALPEPEMDITARYVPPRNDIEKKIVRAWEEVLGIKNIGIEDNFFTLGGHSLKAVTLVAKLQHDFEVNVNDIFKYQTISKLSENIQETKGYLKRKLDRIKKELEGMSYEEGSSVKSAREKYEKHISAYYSTDLTERKNYKNILLTGVTGYLGIHLFMELLEETSCNVYVIIRASSVQEAAERLKNKLAYYFNRDVYEKYRNRIYVLKGDLSEENLGLDGNISISEKIDCIIHSAANVRHYGNYEDFYKSNVLATENLLSFARKGKKKDFNHISTVSVGWGTVEGTEEILFTEEDCDVGQKIENHYVKTKLISEKLVIDARADGIKGNIFRVGNLVYSSKSGLFQENIDENAFYNLIKSYINLGKIPSDEASDLSFIDSVSKAIVMLYDRANLENETYHILNSTTENLAELFTSRGARMNIDSLITGDFIDYLSGAFDIPPYRPYIENVMLHKGWLSEESMSTRFITLSDKTRIILDRISFKWPLFDITKMERMIVKCLESRIEFLNTAPLFFDISRELLREVASMSKLEYYTDNSVLFWEGEKNRKIYIIFDGYLEFFKASRYGWVGTFAVRGHGHIAGEACILEPDTPYLFSVEACMGDVTVLSIDADYINSLVEKNYRFTRNIMKHWKNEIEKLVKIVINL